MAYGHFICLCILRRVCHVLLAYSFRRVPLLLSFLFGDLSPHQKMVGWPELQSVVYKAHALVGRKVLEAVVLETWPQSG